jgi:hypothetical protein
MLHTEIMNVHCGNYTIQMRVQQLRKMQILVLGLRVHTCILTTMLNVVTVCNAVAVPNTERP